jgi:hypothetical protein
MKWIKLNLTLWQKEHNLPLPLLGNWPTEKIVLWLIKAGVSFTDLKKIIKSFEEI